MGSSCALIDKWYCRCRSVCHAHAWHVGVAHLLPSSQLQHGLHLFNGVSLRLDVRHARHGTQLLEEASLWPVTAGLEGAKFLRIQLGDDLEVVATTAHDALHANDTVDLLQVAHDSWCVSVMWGRSDAGCVIGRWSERHAAAAAHTAQNPSQGRRACPQSPLKACCAASSDAFSPSSLHLQRHSRATCANSTLGVRFGISSCKASGPADVESDSVRGVVGSCQALRRRIRLMMRLLMTNETRTADCSDCSLR